jgi:hypothetical protein
MAGKGLYQTQVQWTFCPSPTSSYWKYQRDEADVERRMAVQREARGDGASPIEYGTWRRFCNWFARVR